MPSCALRLAWSSPLIWAVIFSEIASPPASSAAEFIRRPVASFPIALESCESILDFALYEIKDMMLLLILNRFHTSVCESRKTSVFF
jgi:hypothetical protein